MIWIFEYSDNTLAYYTIVSHVTGGCNSPHVTREAEGEIMSDLQYVPKATGTSRDSVGAKRAGYNGGGRKWKSGVEKRIRLEEWHRRKYRRDIKNMEMNMSERKKGK